MSPETLCYHLCIVPPCPCFVISNQGQFVVDEHPPCLYRITSQANGKKSGTACLLGISCLAEAVHVHHWGGFKAVCLPVHPPKRVQKRQSGVWEVQDGVMEHLRLGRDHGKRNRHKKKLIENNGTPQPSVEKYQLGDMCSRSFKAPHRKTVGGKISARRHVLA